MVDTLLNRSKANRRIFVCPSHENRFPTKKALCFSLLRFSLSVSYLLTFFCFYYLQTFGVCAVFESLYIFCFCFPRLFVGAVSLSGSIQL